MDFFIHLIKNKINSMGSLLSVCKSYTTQDLTFTILKNSKDVKFFDNDILNYDYQHYLLILKLQLLYLKLILLKRFSQLNKNRLVRVVCQYDEKERVRILNKDFLLIKCRFRRRLEVGEMFNVPISSIKLKIRNGNFFYEISKRTIIPISIKIFNVSDTPECIICLDNEKSCVFLPCGHFACCKSCADHFQPVSIVLSFYFKNCPVCKVSVNMITKKDFLLEK
jgi:hypothetical protein